MNETFHEVSWRHSYIVPFFCPNNPSPTSLASHSHVSPRHHHRKCASYTSFRFCRQSGMLVSQCGRGQWHCRLCLHCGEAPPVERLSLRWIAVWYTPREVGATSPNQSIMVKLSQQKPTVAVALGLHSFFFFFNLHMPVLFEQLYK